MRLMHMILVSFGNSVSTFCDILTLAVRCNPVRHTYVRLLHICVLIECWLFRHRAVFRRTQSPCRDAAVCRLDRRNVYDTSGGLADRWLGQLCALATATYIRHFHLRSKVGPTRSLVRYLCGWVPVAYIRGLFFFQPPMGYKKRQIDIT